MKRFILDMGHRHGQPTTEWDLFEDPEGEWVTYEDANAWWQEMKELPRVQDVAAMWEMRQLLERVSADWNRPDEWASDVASYLEKIGVKS